jgi:hypothetical protein
MAGLALEETELGEDPEAARRGLGRAPMGTAAAQRLAQLLSTRLAGLAQRAEERHHRLARGERLVERGR